MTPRQFQSITPALDASHPKRSSECDVLTERKEDCVDGHAVYTEECLRYNVRPNSDDLK